MAQGDAALLCHAEAMTALHATTLALGLLAQPTRFLFFTGKGGVGKTSLSTAVAIALADAASNLDEMLGVALSNQPVAVPGVPGLHMLNIDPDTAAEAYRQRVLAQLNPPPPLTSAPRCANNSRVPAPPRSRRSTNLPRC